MSLQLPLPWSPGHMPTWAQLLQQADLQNFKKGQDIIVSPGRLVLTDSNGVTWQITVSTSGVVSASHVTLPARGTSG